MIKNFIGGLSIGIANIIPGVSGGTIMVLLGIFDDIMIAISNIFSFKNGIFKGKKKSFIFLLQIFIGAAIGLIGFAKVIEYLFEKCPNETMFFFIGLIIFSLPNLIKQEMKGIKINKLFFILGLLLIGTICMLSPEKTNIIIKEFPKITAIYLIYMMLIGIIAGATTIFPGISGSMILLIIGEYHLYKSYIANITSMKIEILIPILFIGIGILIGVVLSAKITTWLLKNYKSKTLSVILGLIIASSIALIPINNYIDFQIIIKYILSFLLGGFIIQTINILNKKNTNQN